ncbi:MAG: hypoxanthine phosphoribosyltransferase [Gemmatimonadetes bacterium]|nr:hypoxanthine phosphoribosyltransferase [Gemmatimonadota bacterium]
MAESALGPPRDHRVLYPESQVRERIAQLGREISDHYRDRGALLVIGLLKGSFIFMADLTRALNVPAQMDFMAVSSYGANNKTSGEVQIHLDVRTPLKDRDVLLVEDIVDSGTTLNRLLPQLRAREPRTLEVCALLRKPGNSGIAEPVRWVGFDAPNDFLVGYGLDLAEQYRQLPFIAAI